MSIIKIHLYRQQSTKEEKYLLTYIPEIHQTIASFLEFAVNALNIDICEIDNLVVENDGYTIPQCLDAKILEKINSLTIKVKNISHENKNKLTKINESLLTTHKINNDMRLLEQQSLNLRERMEEENLSDSSTPKFSEDGITKNKTEFEKEKIPTKKQANKLEKEKSKKAETKKSKKAEIPQPESSESEESPEEKKPIKKLELKKGKKMESFKKQSSSEESSVSEEEESESGNESSSESSESSEEELPRVIRTKKAQLKSKIHEKELEKYNKLNTQPKEKESVEKDRKKNPLLERFTKAEKPLEERRELSICVKKAELKVVNNNNSNTKPETERKTTNKPLVEEQLKENKTAKPFPVTYANRKKLIEADDIESSDSSSSSSEEEQVIKKVVNPRMYNISKEQKLSQQEYEKQSIPMVNTNNNNNYSSNKSKMLPPSLRNKPYQEKQQENKQSDKQSDRQENKPLQPSSFKQHQQQQWIPVTKELIATYKQSLTEQNKELSFLKVNNLIRFREIELDEERFVPKESEWIEGTVSKIENDQKIVLNKVTQLGKEFRMKYDTYEHNMVVLEVNRNYLTEEQRLAILPKENNTATNQANQSNVVSQEEKSLVLEQKATEKSEDNQKEQEKPNQDKTSIEKFICGQVNFYFSDKNYPFDLFMQMHANKHPEKYIPIRFLLNFPKIKKILKDEQKLLKYLVEDEKRNERNFEIDEEKKLVRKRVVKINEGQQSEGKIEEEQKAEHENGNGQNDTPQNQ